MAVKKTKKKPATAAPPVIVWDAEQYWAKAVKYFNQMQAQPPGEPVAPFYAALSVEFFARAAICAIHPALNADPRAEGDHILFAFGLPSTAQPRSIPIHSVIARLVRLYPGKFTDDHRKQAVLIIYLRNEELHSASLPFEALTEKDWLAAYYDVVLTIAALLKKRQKDLFPNVKAARAAKAILKAEQDQRLGNVKKKIGIAKHSFDALPPAEQAARQQTSAQALRLAHPSSVSKCPACQSPVLLRGTVIHQGEPKFNGETLVNDVRSATTGIACRACTLQLTGAAEIAIAGLPLRFQEEVEYDLHASREDDDEDEYDNM
jgi:hypothetical protein